MYRGSQPPVCRWSAAGPEAVLSCVRMRRSGGYSPQARPPLGSALNLTAPGIIVSGLTIFGCVNTALEVWSAGNHIDVCFADVLAYGVWVPACVSSFCFKMQEIAFERNAGEEGGAVMLASASSSSFSRCIFADNTAAVGSAMAVRPGALVNDISLCIFCGNWQQSEMRDDRTGRMIDPSRAYNEQTLEIFADRCDRIHTWTPGYGGEGLLLHRDLDHSP